MEISFDIVSLLIAICVSTPLAIWAARLNVKTAKSDFKLSEAVKDDVLKLLSALRACQFKTAQNPNDPNIDLSREKGIITDFFLSPTAIAFYIWAAESSKKSQGEPEERRIFFLRVAMMLNSTNNLEIRNISTDLERCFDGLSEDDFKRIISHLKDVPSGLRKVVDLRPHDPILNALDSIRAKELSPGKKVAFFKFLKSKGIADPDVDLFIAVDDNDSVKLKQAIASGADVQVFDTELLNRYDKELDEFLKMKM